VSPPAVRLARSSQEKSCCRFPFTGKSQAMKFNAAMAMTDAQEHTGQGLRFEPLRKGEVNRTRLLRREQTERNRAGNAVIKPLTRFPRRTTRRLPRKRGQQESGPRDREACRKYGFERIGFARLFSCLGISFGTLLKIAVRREEFSRASGLSVAPRPDRRRNRGPGCLPCIGVKATWSTPPYQRCQPSRPARRPSAVCDDG